MARSVNDARIVQRLAVERSAGFLDSAPQRQQRPWNSPPFAAAAGENRRKDTQPFSDPSRRSDVDRSDAATAQSGNFTTPQARSDNGRVRRKTGGIARWRARAELAQKGSSALATSLREREPAGDLTLEPMAAARVSASRHALRPTDHAMKTLSDLLPLTPRLPSSAVPRRSRCRGPERRRWRDCGSVKC